MPRIRSGRGSMDLFWRRRWATHIRRVEQGLVPIDRHTRCDEPFPYRREEGSDYHRIELAARLLTDLF